MMKTETEPTLSTEKIAELFNAEVANMALIAEALFDRQGRNMPSNVRNWLRGKGYNPANKDKRYNALHLIKLIPEIPEAIVSEVTHLDFSRLDITHIPTVLQYFDDLQVLKLNYCHIHSLQGAPQMEQLEELHLDYNEIITLEGIPELPKLKQLSLGGHGTIDFTGLSPEGFPSLELLSLKYSKVSDMNRPDKFIPQNCRFRHRSSNISYS